MLAKTILPAALLGTALVAPFLASPALAQTPVTLEFWEAHSAQEEAATKEMIKAFEASHPDVKIHMVKTSFGTNFEAITTAVASGTGPDVSPIWSGFLSQFAAEGALLDLDSYGAAEETKNLYKGAVDYGNWEGKIYGLPYAFDPRFMVYNKKAMADAGITEPPRTWDEFVAATEKMAKTDGGKVERYGFGLGSQDGLAYFFITALYDYGGQIFSEDGKKVAFDSDAGVKAGELIAKLAKNTNTLNADGDSLRQGVLTGHVASLFDGPWIFYAAKNTQNPDDFVIGPVPTATADSKPLNFGSVGDYVVYKTSKHPDQAAEFVKFMASPEAQQYRVALLKTGVTPGVLDQPEAQKTFQQWPELKKAQQILDASIIFPKSDHWSDVYSAIISATEAIISGSDPKSALDSAASQANRKLRH
jgi:ABC-type glycerol-3-phosphate transport system substrate-binding protein